MRARRALVTGAGGQDGSLLAALLLDEGYEVAGVVRREAAAYEEALGPIAGRLELVEADLLDQASSSEIFGEARETPQTEETPLRPVTPYGVAKAYAHFIAASYRRRYGMFTCCGILYNHESPLRPVDFLPRKVARAAAAISLGLEQELLLGDLTARRDWGYAGDYVRAMWLMLQHDEPGDYVVATGVSRSVEELVACAFGAVALDWREHVRSDESLFRGTAELHDLVGDPSKARRVLGWEPEVGFEELVAMLVEADCERLQASS